jgi:hypothetical protein
MDLWRLWVSRMHSVWQVIDEMERSDDGLTGKGIYSEAIAKRKKTRIIIAAAAAAVIVAAAVFALFMRGGKGGTTSVPDAARLSVQTSPAHANVFVDGTWIGASPVNEKEVPAGSKALRIELAGYQPIIDTLSLAKDERKTVTHNLAELTGSIKISSEPSGATITIDGKKTDLTTPTVKNGLSVNALHRVDLTLAGYQGGIRDGIRVYRDSTVAVHHAFSKLSGSLRVVSQPPEAETYLDGTLLGTTPCIAEGITYGRHELEVSKNGYRSEVRNIDISKATDEIAFTLSELAPGTIVFSIEPYASVSINGRLLKEDAQFYEVSLPPGKYVVLLQHPKFAPYTVEVEVKSNQADTLRHRFSD